LAPPFLLVIGRGNSDWSTFETLNCYRKNIEANGGG
jgi:hypothetical protein